MQDLIEIGQNNYTPTWAVGTDLKLGKVSNQFYKYIQLNYTFSAVHDLLCDEMYIFGRKAKKRT